MVSDYSSAISKWENTIVTGFHLLFTFMTSIIIFFKIYSEALQAIRISIATFIVILFREHPVWNSSKVCRVGLTDKRKGFVAL